MKRHGREASGALWGKEFLFSNFNLNHHWACTYSPLQTGPPTPICRSHYPPLDPAFLALTEPRVRSHSGGHPW